MQDGIMFAARNHVADESVTVVVSCCSWCCCCLQCLSRTGNLPDPGRPVQLPAAAVYRLTNVIGEGIRCRAQEDRGVECRICGRVSYRDAAATATIRGEKKGIGLSQRILAHSHSAPSPVTRPPHGHHAGRRCSLTAPCSPPAPLSQMCPPLHQVIGPASMVFPHEIQYQKGKF